MARNDRVDAHEFKFVDGCPTLDGNRLITRSVTYNEDASERGIATVTVEIYIKPCSIIPNTTEIPEVV